MAAKPKPKLCILCKSPLAKTAWPTLFLHPTEGACTVRVTNALGMSVDDLYFVDPTDNALCARVPDEGEATFGAPVSEGLIYDPSAESAFLSADAGIRRMFELAGLPMLGGMSGPRGWSSISTFQRCRYLWLSKYGNAPVVDESTPRFEALEVGTLTHLFVAVHYQQIIQSNPATASAAGPYPLTPEDAVRFLREAMVTPGYIDQAWALFEGYRFEYQDELSWMTPLAVEHLAVDPRDNASCRWDLVFRIDQPYQGLLPGVYVANTKTAGRNDLATREQWKNDGQILGEIDLYDRLRFEKLWGPRRGACINLIIKTKAPQYLRTWVNPGKGVLRNFRKDRAVWVAEMELAAATGMYPRSRASCVTQYHTLCELFDHCAGADAPREFD